MSKNTTKRSVLKAVFNGRTLSKVFICTVLGAAPTVASSIYIPSKPFSPGWSNLQPVEPITSWPLPVDETLQSADNLLGVDAEKWTYLGTPETKTVSNSLMTLSLTELGAARINPENAREMIGTRWDAITITSGFPFECGEINVLQQQSLRNGVTQILENDGYALPSGGRRVAVHEQITLPTKFHAASFAANSLFYGLILLGLYEGIKAPIRAVKSRKLIKQSRCGRCGYEGGANGCPECGRGMDRDTELLPEPIV